MRKRVLSLLLAICLVVGLLPPTALATGGTPTENVVLEIKGASVAWTATPNQVYYATTTAAGAVTDITSTYVDDATTPWNIKLDNTKAVAELTLKGATVKGTSSQKAMVVSGNGALKIIVDGDSLVQAAGADALTVGMAGGTTITSVNNSQLSAITTSTAMYAGIAVTAGSLTLQDANVYLSAKNQNNAWPVAALNAYLKVSNSDHRYFDVTIAGGTLEIEGVNTGVTGILAKNLTIQDYAKVTVINNGGKYDSLASAAVTNKRMYGVRATGDLALNNASLTIINKDVGESKGSWLYAINKIPAGLANVAAKYSTTAAGTDLQVLDTSATGEVAYPYVAFTYICDGHTYTNDSDPDCNKCGETRDVPMDITVRVVTGRASATGTNLTKTIAAGEVYYAVANADGLVETFEKMDTEPADWDFKLDNSKPVAELVFNNAYLRMIGEWRDPSNNQLGLLNISGQGKLKVITKGDSTIESSDGITVTTNMTGGTTYTSENNAQLKIVQLGSNLGSTIKEGVGTLTFDHANVYAENAHYQTKWSSSIISAAGNMNVTGGRLEVVAKDNNATNTACALHGISVTGVLTLSDYAVVTVEQKSATDKFSFQTDYPRYGVNASSIVINDASLYIIDNAEDMFEYAINKMPTLNSNVTAHYSESVDGSNLQTLAPADLTAKIEHPYVAFVFTCDGHIYDNDADSDCNKCGATREVPKNITVTFGSSTTWNAAAGEIYYATTNASGAVTSLGALTTEPAEWNIKLDNTKLVAELTLKGATVVATGSINAVTVSGEGALKIIVDGNSTLHTGAADTLTLSMATGTTITSVNNSKLSVITTSTSAWRSISATAGYLTFQDANVYLSSKCRNDTWPIATLSASGRDVTIAGGTFVIDAFNMGSNGISAGSLTLKDYAKVTAIHSTTYSNDNYDNIDANALAAKRMYGVSVSGDFVINNASLKLINQDVSGKKGSWIYAVNKMPTGLTNVKAEYSENDDGTNLQTLNPADATANVVYPYVAFSYICDGHAYDNSTDPDCNKCGEIRDVPRELTVIFGNHTSTIDQEVVWNVAVGEIYYAKTDDSGVMTNLGALAAEPAEWNIKLDNTKPVAELTLKGATLKKTGESGYSNSHNAIKTVGDGALKIIVDGASTIESGYNNAIETNMGGGTTYTSLNNSLLTVVQGGTSGSYSIIEKVGNLTFENANIYTSGKRQGAWSWHMIHGAGDVTINGGSLSLEAINCAVEGIYAGGNLTITNLAKVNLLHSTSVANTFTATEARPRHGVEAGGAISITNASLRIQDKSGKWEIAINKMPTLNGVKAEYSVNTDGSDLQVLNPADPAAAIEYPYVAFALICNSHEYDNNTDPDCNKCGAIREVPREITVRVTTGKKSVNLADITKVIAAGEVYYGVADETGLVTSFEAATTAPADWDFKLDNTKPVAELVFNNAYLSQDGEVRDGNNDPIGLINISGDGALKVITETASTLETGYGNVIKTNMAGGTTYTSTNNSLLNVLQRGTGGLSNIAEAVGSLTFENANIYASNKRQGSWSYFLVSGVGAVNVNGGSLLLEAINCAVEGIYAGGNLAITNYAKVSLLHSTSAANTYTATEARPRHAVEVVGNITVADASLRIQDVSGKWEVAINKMPTLGNVNAEFSANADGSNAQALTPADPAAAIEYPYVGFILNCTSHVYDNDADHDCNKCGTVRPIPRPLTVIFGNYVKDKINQEVVWNVEVGQVYYAKTDADGVMTNLGALAAEPAEWNIKLDNTNPTAELTLKGANLKKLTESGYSASNDAIQVVGDGALKIIIDSDSTIESGYNNVIKTSMGGGTTYTSNGNAQLNVLHVGTSLGNNIMETVGTLTFDHANVLATNAHYAPVWTSTIISSAKDMNVIGGKLELAPKSKNASPAYALRGISVSGVLTLSDYALVYVQQKSVGTDAFKGVKDRLEAGASVQYRYGVKADDIVINNASLYIIDNAEDMFEYAINKMPTLTGDVTAYYSTSTDGSNLQNLTAANTTALTQGPAAAIEFPYVAFALICNNHEYDNASDPDCNKCGATRIVPKDITIRIVTDGAKAQSPLTDAYDRKVTVAYGEVYYGVNDAKGYVTEFTKTEPAGWTFKLDNTKPVAELVFNNAYLRKSGTYRETVGEKTAILNLITVSGEGTLKVVTKGASTLESYYGNVLETQMVGGTTYTSENEALLTVQQQGTSGLAAITETVGVLNFENANIHALNKRQGTYKHDIVSAVSDVNVSGGTLLLEAINCSTNGLNVSGNLKLTNYASVRLLNEKTNVSDYKPDKQGPRYAVKINGEITIDNASLRITDAIGHWDVAINKTPKLIGSVAKYSESAEATNLQALNPADPTAAIEYPYVEYVVACTEHIWDSAVDAQCNRCGLIRAVPYAIQVAFQFGATELQTVAWDAKVGEIYYATTTADGQVIDLGKKDSEPAKWNIKLDNTGAEAVLTLRDANITRKVRPASSVEIFGIKYGSLGNIIAKGAGALRIVTEKASTITVGEAYFSIHTYMDGGTTYASKDNAKLTVKATKTCVTGGIVEEIGNLTFDHANVSLTDTYTHGKYSIVAASTPRNMTVIGGKVEIIAGSYGTSGLSVGGNLTVKDKGILIVSTGSKASGTAKAKEVFGVKVKGDITIDDATLMIKNYAKYWHYLINKMPNLVNAAAYSSATSTKESKLAAFTMDAGADMTALEEKAIFYYFSNAKPGTLDTSMPGEDEVDEEEDDDFLFDDPDNPYTGDTVNLTLLFVLVLSSAAALVVLFFKKNALRE